MGAILFVIGVIWHAVKSEGERKEREAKEKTRAWAQARAEEDKAIREKQAKELKTKTHQLKRMLIAIGAVNDSEDFDEAIVVCGNGHVHHYSSFYYVAGTNVRTHTSRRTSYNIQTVSNTTYASPTDAFGFSDFGPGTRYDSSQTIQTPETEYDTDTNSELEWEFGCPTCHTTVFEFKDEFLNEYVACGTGSSDGNGDEDEESAGHWYLNTYSGCPLCTEEPVVLSCPHCGFEHSMSVHRLQESFCTQCGTCYEAIFTAFIAAENMADEEQIGED